MTSTALGAETKKEEKIIFISDAHEKFYYEKLKEVRYQDVYHKALCYCLGISDDTRRNVYRIYDFKTGCVITECLHEGWQTSGSVRVIRMAFNLYCNGTPSVSDYEDAEEQVDECRQYTVEEIFCCAYAPYFWQAIQIRYPEYATYNHKLYPFRVLDDEKMEETTESISKYGVLVPGIARPRAEGGYEIIAGHRRKRGSERAGKEDMPVIVRNYTDDEATIIMVDSNIQREDILPSEKAKAYAMKYEAMKHQGRKGNGNTLDEVGEAAGESGKTVQRYIWLARLSDELLELVDRKKIGLVQGVDISFLSEDAQQWVLVILEESGANISTVQSAKLKEYGKSGELTLPMVRLILTEEKPKERKVTIKSEKISQFFSEEYSSEEIEGIILQLLEEWQKKQ